MKHRIHPNAQVALALALIITFTAGDVLAGTGGTAFDDIWLTLTDWTQGTLGRIIAGSMVVVGLVGGVARQSLMPLGLGVGSGMGLYNTPTVIDSIMTGTLPVQVAEITSSAAVATAVIPL
ncbi:conjugal transfer pilus assembly protein TraA [Azospirillum sp. OGB3]|uniref:TraA family conjugative transfer protein n=1 Tax=Azospirillum sp. OGB3 TaxID=2587012 RepID=UPI0017F15FA1|nr:TraA family conjugative transfer protein [Azospirillum sp. OGB3]MBB3268621.1 conjugal transfer pilus assembly protein TraA [Azospirillum sp. OGB3]